MAQPPPALPGSQEPASPGPGHGALRGGCESRGQGTSPAAGPAALQPLSAGAEPFAGSVARGSSPRLPTETCFSSLSPVAASQGWDQPGHWLGGWLRGGGHSLAPEHPRPFAVLVLKPLKHMYLSTLLCSPSCAVSGVLRASSSVSQPGDEDGGPDVSLVPSIWVPPCENQRRQGDPGEHPALPSSTTLSWEVLQGPRGLPPSPEKLPDRLGGRGASSSYTAQPRCNFGCCRNRLTPGRLAGAPSSSCHPRAPRSSGRGMATSFPPPSLTSLGCSCPHTTGSRASESPRLVFHVGRPRFG